jgi:hypothetical protein
MVIAELIDNIWTCPECYSIRLAAHLWEYTEEYQKRFEDNTKFIKFVKGQ